MNTGDDDDMIRGGFEVLKTCSGSSARTGVYKVAGKQAIATPGFLAATSRGVVPHLTPDNVKRLENAFAGFSVAAEDFLDRLPQEERIPFLNGSDMRRLLGLPEDLPIVASPRRSSPVAVSVPNTNDAVSIMTSEGTKKMPLDAYLRFVKAFNPDVVLAPPDLPNLSPGGRPGGNRIRKMANRAEKWLDATLDFCTATDTAACTAAPNWPVFAVVLPSVPDATQREYLAAVGERRRRISGLSFWGTEDYMRPATRQQQRDASQKPEGDPANVAKAIAENGLEPLVRFYALGCATPQEVLDRVAQGMDLFQGDCCTQFTDAGIALDFSFPPPEAPESDDARLELGSNLWDEKYATDMRRLSATSTATGSHNRAYIHHLLKAREMTSWVLLQMNNVDVLSRFFAGIRTSIANGTFAQDHARFVAVYGDVASAKSFRDQYRGKSTGPTARGYAVGHLEQEMRKNTGSTTKINDPPFRKL
ncbi:hypothetical protein TRICI_006307 [Trichomonascus ciferrii]|uniref:tRNA-guanine(15) transglycosylase-like domain-containing protein n=1 Tax=Trichomonascus ciferrii TaxID=44093 RepID=A0A642UIR8_9ASCO|nr:hypothetical protein TRICI_006307 [Trichomonascus ciferrii]